MSVKRLPAGRIGMTTIPARVEVVASTPPSAEEKAAAHEVVQAASPTFEQLVQPVEEWARAIVVEHGGIEIQPGAERPEGYLRWSFWFVPRVELASKLDYAMRVLSSIRNARSNAQEGNLDGAMRHAWNAGSLAQEALMKSVFEGDFVAGERSRAQGRRGHEGGRPRGKGQVSTEELQQLKAMKPGPKSAAIEKLVAAPGRNITHAGVRAALRRLKTR